MSNTLGAQNNYGGRRLWQSEDKINSQEELMRNHEPGT